MRTDDEAHFLFEPRGGGRHRRVVCTSLAVRCCVCLIPHCLSSAEYTVGNTVSTTYMLVGGKLCESWVIVPME